MEEMIKKHVENERNKFIKMICENYGHDIDSYLRDLNQNLADKEKPVSGECNHAYVIDGSKSTSHMICAKCGNRTKINF